MKTKYNNLDELRRKKELLKKDVEELEDLLTFENTKESLSAFTNGFTDNFLTEKIDDDGETKLALKTGSIVKEIGDTLTNRSQKNSIINFDNTGLQSNLLESTLKLGSVAFVGNMARKNLKSGSWRNRLIGLALVYLLPYALRFIRTKLEEFQKKQSLSSMEKLI